MAETTNLGKVVITPKGEHSTATAYARLDLVAYNGSSYLSKQDVPTGIAIDNTAYWFCMAKGTYQIWLDEGNTGSASDYLNSVTAYGNAVLGGYTGTQEQFYDDLALVSDALTALDIADNLTTTTKGKVLDASQGKILDETKVNNTGDETIQGIKTFESSPIIPAPTTDSQAATKQYVDDADNLKIDKSSITSELGGSEELVMSQKGVSDEMRFKADLVDGTVPAEQLPPELDTTLYVTNVAHRKRRIKDASEVEDSSASWTLVKGNDYLKRLPDILGLGLYLVSQDLTEHKKLSKTNSNFYADGSPAALDGSEGDIQMCWRKPIYIKYYEKQEADGLYEHFEVSHLNIFGECEMIPPGGGFPAVLDRTTTTLRALYSTDANYRGGNNASSYDADPLKTLLGKPASNLSAYTSELYAKKRGDLWTSGGTPFFATLAILQIMFFGTNNSQADIVSDDVLVDGSGFQRSKIATEGLFEGSFGVNNAFPSWDTYNAYNPTFDLSAGFVHGDITGRRVYTIPDWSTAGTTQTIQLAYFFGMPWPFNHMWYGDAHQRVDQQTVEQGFKTVVYQKRDITTAPISGGPSTNGVIPPAPWEKVAEAYRSNGYIRRVSWNGLSMIPTEAGGAGGTSTFYCDYLYNNGETSFGWRAPLRFARLDYGSGAGAFIVSVYNTPTNANANYGAFCCHFTEGIAPRKIEK